MKHWVFFLIGLVLLGIGAASVVFWWHCPRDGKALAGAVCLLILCLALFFGCKALKEGMEWWMIKRSKKKRAASRKLHYDELWALYLDQPIYEPIEAELDRSERTLELYFEKNSYLLALDRLQAEYRTDLCTSLLAQGEGFFGAFWPQMRLVLEKQQQKRETPTYGRMLPQDGLILTYQTKEGRELRIILLSNVFFQMRHMIQDIGALLPQKEYSRVEL